MERDPFPESGVTPASSILLRGLRASAFSGIALLLLARGDHGPLEPPDLQHTIAANQAPPLHSLRGPVSLMNGTVTVEIDVDGQIIPVPVTFRGHRGRSVSEVQVSSRRFVVQDRLSPDDAQPATDRIRDILWNGHIELKSDMGTVAITLEELQRVVRSLRQNPSGNCIESVEFSFTGLASVYGGGKVTITFVEVQPTGRFEESVARNQ